jgi:hypothetical protein
MLTNRYGDFRILVRAWPPGYVAGIQRLEHGLIEDEVFSGDSAEEVIRLAKRHIDMIGSRKGREAGHRSR